MGISSIMTQSQTDVGRVGRVYNTKKVGGVGWPWSGILIGGLS